MQFDTSPQMTIARQQCQAHCRYSEFRWSPLPTRHCHSLQLPHKEGLTAIRPAVRNSARLGLAKPDADAFKTVASLLGVPVARCLFVDDTRPNVEGARQAGMQAEPFTSVTELRNLLVRGDLLMLPLPEPALDDGVVRLRPWSAHDVDALVAAWADEEIQKWTRVPEHRGSDHALRWIAAEQLRRDRGLALDLVISPADPDDATVLGEVGMVPLAGGPSRAELGWWVAVRHRRQGIVTWRDPASLPHGCETSSGSPTCSPRSTPRTPRPCGSPNPTTSASESADNPKSPSEGTEVALLTDPWVVARGAMSPQRETALLRTPAPVG